jgi:hypothetical protein
MVFSPCPPWLWGFFLEEEDEGEWNDESVYEWICRAPESYFIRSGNASGVMIGRRALMGIQTTGVFPWMRRFFSTK